MQKKIETLSSYNKKSNFNPEDFVKNYSLYRKADLIIDIENEKSDRTLNKIFKKIIKNFLGKDLITIKNDYKIREILKKIEKERGAIIDEFIIEYIEEKFSKDHLRKFEYSFQANCLLKEEVKKDLILDIGGGNSYSSIIPALFNFKNARILSLDVINQNSKSSFGIEYINGNSINTDLSNDLVSVVSIISTLEHIGLGRWGDPIDPDGDIKTMQEIRRVLKMGGHCILTIPFGYPAVVFNLHRIYDEGRIKTIGEGFEIVLEEYSLNGKSSNKEDTRDIKVSKDIVGFYQNIPEERRHYNSPAGIMLLLKKI